MAAKRPETTIDSKLTRWVTVAILATLAIVLFGPSGPVGSRIWQTIDGWRIQRQLVEAWPTLIDAHSRLAGPKPQRDRIVVEFVDYECPFCRSGAIPVLESVAADEADLVVRHLPLDGIHPNAIPAARASICSERYGAFSEAHTELLTNDEWLDAANWSQFAFRVGIEDATGFLACMSSEETNARLKEDARLAALLGVLGTPAFLTEHGLFRGSYESAIASLPSNTVVESTSMMMTLADDLVFASDEHVDPAIHNIGQLNAALFTLRDRIVFVDGRAIHLVFVDTETGSHRIQGRDGEGPGEYGGLAPQLQRGPEGPIAWDVNLRRATYYSNIGEMLGTRGVSNGLSRYAGLETLLGGLEGGQLVFLVAGEFRLDLPDGTIARPTAFLQIHEADGVDFTRLLDVATTESLILKDPPRFPYTQRRVLFGHRTHIAVSDTVIVVADTESNTVVSYSRAGTRAPVMPIPGEALEVTEMDVELAKAERRSADSALAERSRAAGFAPRPPFDGDVARDFAPPMDRMHVDRSGRLWIRIHAMPTDSVQLWTVWDMGRQLMSVEIPGSQKFLDAYGDRLLLDEADDLGVQRLVVRRMEPAR